MQIKTFYIHLKLNWYISKLMYYDWSCIESDSNVLEKINLTTIYVDWTNVFINNLIAKQIYNDFNNSRKEL